MTATKTKIRAKTAGRRAPAKVLAPEVEVAPRGESEEESTTPAVAPKPAGASAVTITWKQRSRVEDCVTSERRIWETVEGDYRVVHTTPKFEGLTDKYFAMRLTVHVEKKTGELFRTWVGVEVDKSRNVKGVASLNEAMTACAMHANL